MQEATSRALGYGRACARARPAARPEAPAPADLRGTTVTMDVELPNSPMLERFLAESPWMLAFPLVVAAAALAWWGARNERARPILAGAGLLLAAAATLGAAHWWTSPGERAAIVARELVAAAEAADMERIRGCFAPDASLHYGSPRNPGDDLERLMAAAESLRGRRRIERNDITQLDVATVDADRGIAMLGCRTEVKSGYGPVPTLWWIEVRRMPDGGWKIDRLAWLRLLNQVPDRGAM